MIRLWAIAQNTFVQTIRQPVYGIIILATFAVIAASLPLSGWTMGGDYHASDQKQLESLCLATLLISGLLVAAFSASSVLSREIEDRTALTVISKPVSRATFVLGKFAGVSAAVAAAFYLCSLAALLVLRHRVMSAAPDPFDWPVIILGCGALVLALVAALLGNYFFGWHFVSAGVWASLLLLTVAMAVVSFVGKGWKIVPLGFDTPTRQMIGPQLLVGIGLIFMAVLIFSAVAVAASTRLSQVMTLLVCCAVFFVGSIHPFLFGRWAEQVPAARVLGWVAPNLTTFFPLDALIRGKAFPASYVALAASYCGLYVAAVLALGMALFQRRQLEAQGASSTMPGAVALLAWAGRLIAIGLGLAGVIGVSLPAYQNAQSLLVLGGMLCGGAVIWILASGMGNGARWAYWLNLVVAAVATVAGGLASALPATFGIDPTGHWRIASLAGGIVAAGIILILVLPKTRRHFE